MCQACIEDGSVSQAVFGAIEEFIEIFPQAEFGPAHIVLSDCNVSDAHINLCLGLLRAVLMKRRGQVPFWLTEENLASLDSLNWYEDNDTTELCATVKFLETLLFIPEDDR